ncbi:MAG: phosphodiester glycosidase family protein [Lachnospiraceae bacterium]|nr:phosphodiester glycosidase family protein [Lachnospiraceae bacterium]
MKVSGTKIFALTYGLLLTGLTAYVLLDSFVIPHRYAEVESREEPVVIAEENTAVTEVTEDEAPAAEVVEKDKSVAKDDAGTAESVKSRARKGSGEKRKERAAAESDLAAEDTDRAASGESEKTESADTEKTASAHYEEAGTEISLNEYRVNDTDVYVADIKLQSAESLKTAFAGDCYGRNVTAKTSRIAEDNGAVLAINGDFYGSRESGYVIREGVLYRDRAAEGNEDLVIMKDGSFRIINESEVGAQELLDMGAWNVFSFGPALVSEGEIAVSEGEEVGKAMQSNPRTAIGIIDELHYVFVVADGRTTESEGLTLSELAKFMKELGVQTAYNLDGGGSSTMVYQGQLINNPTTGGKKIGERSVSDIVYIR